MRYMPSRYHRAMYIDEIAKSVLVGVLCAVGAAVPVAMAAVLWLECVI